MRLYVPGTVLQEGSNDLVLLEMDSVPGEQTGVWLLLIVWCTMVCAQCTWWTSQTFTGLLRRVQPRRDVHATYVSTRCTLMFVTKTPDLHKA